MKATLILPSSLLDFHQIGYSVPLCSVFIFSLSVFNKPPGFVNCPCSVILEDFWPFHFPVHFFLVLFLFPLWTSAYARSSSMTFPASLWGFVFSSVMFPLCFLDHRIFLFIPFLYIVIYKITYIYGLYIVIILSAFSLPSSPSILFHTSVFPHIHYSCFPLEKGRPLRDINQKIAYQAAIRWGTFPLTKLDEITL